VSIRVIVGIFEGANECPVCSKTDLPSGPVKVWFTPVGCGTREIRCRIGDFGIIREVTGGIRGEDEGKLGHKFGEFGTSAVKILRFMESWGWGLLCLRSVSREQGGQGDTMLYSLVVISPAGFGSGTSSGLWDLKCCGDTTGCYHT